MRTNKDQQAVNVINDLFILLGKYQNQLQAHREHLTLRNDFNPQCLYKYLTLGQQELTRNHIMYFMEENSKPMRQDQSKLLFSVYGYKDKLTYADFLNYIYPFDTQAVKTISTVHCKKYIKNQDEQPTEEEIQFLHKFQELKSEKLSNCTRELIKKWVKLLKKYVPPSSGGINSDYVLTFAELKTIMKNLKNLPQRKAQPICRRLSLQKQSFIGIDQLEIWLKPWFKQKQEETLQSVNSQTLFADLSESLIASKID